MNTEQAPAALAGDTVYGRGGRFVSYGPRRDFGGNVEAVAPGYAQFWGVYEWRGERDRWRWVQDCNSFAEAGYAALSLLGR